MAGADPRPPVGELALIEWLTARLPGAPPGQTWIGDDAAVVDGPAGPLLLAIDTVVVGVHADLELSDLADLGWKAMAVNVSDLAAMGGLPLHALVSVVAPPGTDVPRLYDGLLEASAAYACPVVGGDLTSGAVLVVTVAVTGQPSGGGPVRRGGARPGHLLWVTGPLGAAAAGLEELRAGRRSGPGVFAHLRPQARLSEGGAAARAGASAMIDVSDGLAIDLWRLGVSSGLALDLDSVPVAEGATLAQALGGGEDYELAFTAPPDADVTGEFVRAGLRPPVALGRAVAGPAGRLSLAGEPLDISGWEHSF